MNAPMQIALLACSVCFSSEGESRTAYYAVTIFLTLLPFTLLGGIAWIVKKNVK